MLLASLVLLLTVDGAFSQAPTAAQNAFNSVQNLIDTNDSSGGTAILKILENDNFVQDSNLGSNSWRLENAGSKRIAAVFIDVTNAIFRDVVFDDNGSGGDSAAKKLKSDSNEAQVGAISIDNYQWLRLPA